MGPRSDERGKAKKADKEQASEAELQWGRVRMNAESAILELHNERSNLMLQWGRVRMNAERGSALAGTASFKSLQWGRVRMNAESS